MLVEWEQEENGDLICSIPSSDLNEASLKIVLNSMTKMRKNGLYVTYRKKSDLLIVSPSDEYTAKKLMEIEMYKKRLPKGCKIDPTLDQGQWFVKFVDAKAKT